MRLAFISGLVAIASLIAWANDTAVVAVSGNIAPMGSHPSIRMISERVEAKLGWDTAAVRCEFIFKNEGKATTVKIGFPEQAYGDVSPIKQSSFVSFKSWVDGKPVKTKFMPSKEEEDAGVTYNAWHIKEVPFAAGQTRKVTNEYTATLGVDSMGGVFFDYVLRTGKSWKGTIGDALIIVDVSTPSKFYDVQPSPKGYRLKDGKLEWKFHDFEPDQNILVRLEPPKVLLNDRAVVLADPEGFARGGIQMASARYLEQAVKISWDPKTTDCVFAIDDHTLRVRAGATKATLDGARELELPRAPFVDRSGQLIIPIAAVVELLGGSVESGPGKRDLKMRIP